MWSFPGGGLPGDATAGPRGAQGVALTAGRSIAVDPRAFLTGTPVWLASHGPAVNLQRLVVAQDTGSAIVGAVRADYFVARSRRRAASRAAQAAIGSVGSVASLSWFV